MDAVSTNAVPQVQGSSRFASSLVVVITSAAAEPV